MIKPEADPILVRYIGGLNTFIIHSITISRTRLPILDSVKRLLKYRESPRHHHDGGPAKKPDAWLDGEAVAVCFTIIPWVQFNADVPQILH